MRRVPTLVFALVLAGCNQAAVTSNPPAATEVAAPSASVHPDPSLAATANLAPGRLAAGVRYVLPGFDGLSVQVEDEAWLAILANGGDIILTAGQTTVYLVQPQTIVSPDQSQRLPWPATPTEARAALDATRGVAVEDAEPITIAGIETELLRVSASRQAEGPVMLQSSSGDFGLPDGESAIILLPIGDRVVYLSLEASGSYERALDEGQPLIDGMSSDD